MYRSNSMKAKYLDTLCNFFLATDNTIFLSEDVKLVAIKV